MKGNCWAIQVSKNDEGKVCLEFCGYFHISAKQVAYIIIIGLVAFSSTVSYVIHYLK